jgi:hypothetical protein
MDVLDAHVSPYSGPVNRSLCYIGGRHTVPGKTTFPSSEKTELSSDANNAASQAAFSRDSGEGDMAPTCNNERENHNNPGFAIERKKQQYHA